MPCRRELMLQSVRACAMCVHAMCATCVHV